MSRRTNLELPDFDSLSVGVITLSKRDGLRFRLWFSLGRNPQYILKFSWGIRVNQLTLLWRPRSYRG